MLRIIVSSAALCVSLFTAQAQGKGLDDINSSAEATVPSAADGATPAEGVPPTEGAPSTEGAPQPAGVAPPTEGVSPPDGTPPPEGAPPAEGTPPKEEASPPAEGEAAKTEAPIERSALSLKLENRLYLATSMNFGSISGSEGTWSSAANGDIQAGFNLLDTLPRQGRLFGTVRYAPFDFVLKKGVRYYRGIAEAWYFGALALFGSSDKMSYSAAVEAGYVGIHLDSADGDDVISKDEKGGVTINLSGGVDWKLLEKLRVGPSLGLGFGSYKTVQVGAKATFLF